MDKFEQQRRAIGRAIRDAQYDLTKARQASASDPTNQDFADWVEEATATVKGLEMARESIIALEMFSKLLTAPLRNK